MGGDVGGLLRRRLVCACFLRSGGRFRRGLLSRREALGFRALDRRLLLRLGLGLGLRRLDRARLLA
ncbi:MAG: hypothetical protein ACRDNX_01610, partial [Gaiellaceae bacterium]